MLLKTERDGAFEVDMRVGDRCDVLDMVLRSVPIWAFGDPFVLMRVPGDDDVCEQGKRAGDRCHLLARPASTWRDRARVDSALQRVHGFDLAKKPLDFLPEIGPSKIVAKER